LFEGFGAVWLCDLIKVDFKINVRGARGLCIVNDIPKETKTEAFNKIYSATAASI